MKPLKDKELEELLRAKVAQDTPEVSDDHWATIARQLPKGQWNGRWQMATAAGLVVIALLIFNGFTGSEQAAGIEQPVESQSAPSTPATTHATANQYTKDPAALEPSSNPPVSRASILPPADDQDHTSSVANPVSEDVTPNRSMPADLDHLPPTVNSKILRPSNRQVVPVPVLPVANATQKARHPLRPQLISAEAQLYFHTLNPFLEDENRLQNPVSQVPFINRASFSFNTGYQLQLSMLTIEYGLGLDLLSSEMRFTIANAPDNAEQMIRNRRINLGLWTSAIIDARKFHLPGYLEGNVTFRYRMWASPSETNAYSPAIFQYHLRYGLYLNDHTNLYLGYGSLIKPEQLPTLGSLRPHIYSVGMKYYLR